MSRFLNIVLGYVCELPMERGPCRAIVSSFGYNSVTNQCERFIYGGCGGNGNRFLTRDACEDQCQEEGSVHHHILVEAYHNTFQGCYFFS